MTCKCNVTCSNCCFELNSTASISNNCDSSHSRTNVVNRKYYTQWKVWSTVCTLFCMIFFVSPCQGRYSTTDPCYTHHGDPQKCEPEFENIALWKQVVVSETCGTAGSEPFCRREEFNGIINRVCEYCEDAGRYSHPASLLTDINDSANLTYWQSKTFTRPRERDVTLSISFGKQYSLSYVYLQFQSPRPKSMVIYKSMNRGRTWAPYQYYANSCSEHFGMDSEPTEGVEWKEQEPLCSEKYSKSLPVSGGHVVFSPTAEKDADNEKLDSSFLLQDWVTATDIKIVLREMNVIDDKMQIVDPAPLRKAHHRGSTQKRRWSGFRHDVTPKSVPKGTVVRPAINPLNFASSMFYAINDITIGGICKCNGHASRCVSKNDKLQCDCKHNTEGVNCERCRPFHFDRPWKRATTDNANQCVRKSIFFLFMFA